MTSDRVDHPLRSGHTPRLPEVLAELGVSLAVTTYQAGKLIFLRADGGVLNTHFRGFDVPMGIAAAGGRLAVGTKMAVTEFHDAPAVAARLVPEGRHDACYLPRVAHHTGDVRIHEMAWADGPGGAGGPELWFVNTRFSCLCTRSGEHSFVARWRPPFVTALAPEDRCHLNGLALRDGRPRYVTAMSASDRPEGWRDRKRDGGIVIDVDTNETLVGGLSMPHSPRWHAGRLWVLNSGEGTLGTVDLARGRYEPVAAVPGFTRGLDFAGRYAFVGLSQVRETAVFSGIAIAGRPADERRCGVWVIDTVTGRTEALVRFDGGVQEVFAVAVLPHRFPDLINDDRALLADSFVVPDETLAAVPLPLRRRAV